MNLECKYKWFKVRSVILTIFAIFFFIVVECHFVITIGSCSDPEANYNLSLLLSVMIAFYVLNVNMFMLNISHEYSMATLEDREVSFELKDKYLYLHKKRSYGILIILFFISLITFANYNSKAFFINHTVDLLFAVLYSLGMSLYAYLVISNVSRSTKSHDRIIETKNMYDRNMARLKAMKSRQGGNNNV